MSFLSIFVLFVVSIILIFALILGEMNENLQTKKANTFRLGSFDTQLYPKI